MIWNLREKCQNKFFSFKTLITEVVSEYLNDE